jgi:predicted DNA-binding protein
MPKLRTHILLDPDQHKNLVQLARREGRSVSELTREIVQQGIEQRKKSYVLEQKKRMQALEIARKVRQSVLQDHDGAPLDLNIDDVITEMRAARDGKILDRGD